MSSHYRFKDLTGLKFDRLTVVEMAPHKVYSSGKRYIQWRCRCDCGSETFVISTLLITGRTRSCGCLLLDMMKARSGERAYQFKHGGSRSREYQSWHNARKRIFNKSNERYPSYGGRGISMCDSWANDFAQFLADMGPCPEGMTLERNDVNGNYDKENCRWATPKEQVWNKSNTKRYQIGEKLLTLLEWSEISGIPKKRIWTRIERDGWPPERGVFEPINTTWSRRRKKLKEMPKEVRSSDESDR